jgi:hypothetical protein
MAATPGHWLLVASGHRWLALTSASPADCPGLSRWRSVSHRKRRFSQFLYRCVYISVAKETCLQSHCLATAVLLVQLSFVTCSHLHYLVMDVFGSPAQSLVSSFSGTQQSRCLPPSHLRTETDPVSETLCFLVFRICTMDEVRKPSYSERLFP